MPILAGSDAYARHATEPVYTMGSKPVVHDQQWIDAQKKLIRELGKDAYFRRQIQIMRATFGEFVE